MSTLMDRVSLVPTSCERTVAVVPDYNWPNHLAHLLKTIARQTKNAAKVIKNALVRFGKFLAEKNREAEEMHRRLRESENDRFYKNHFHIRGML